MQHALSFWYKAAQPDAALDDALSAVCKAAGGDHVGSGYMLDASSRDLDFDFPNHASAVRAVARVRELLIPDLSPELQPEGFCEECVCTYPPRQR